MMRIVEGLGSGVLDQGASALATSVSAMATELGMGIVSARDNASCSCGLCCAYDADSLLVACGRECAGRCRSGALVLRLRVYGNKWLQYMQLQLARQLAAP